ncbi:MAG: hypothetical protein WEB00_14745 [Dehalococcoidia bacterium]
MQTNVWGFLGMVSVAAIIALGINAQTVIGQTIGGGARDFAQVKVVAHDGPRDTNPRRRLMFPAPW